MHLLLVLYFMVFIIMFTSMEEVFVVLRNLEQENQALHEYVAHL
jgi:ABC-type uncharacterized transport system permease subunit